MIGYSHGSNGGISMRFGGFLSWGRWRSVYIMICHSSRTKVPKPECGLLAGERMP